MVFFLQVCIYSRTEACEKDILNQIFQIVEVILNRYMYILPWSMQLARVQYIFVPVVHKIASSNCCLDLWHLYQ